MKLSNPISGYHTNSAASCSSSSSSPLAQANGANGNSSSSHRLAVQGDPIQALSTSSGERKATELENSSPVCSSVSSSSSLGVSGQTSGSNGKGQQKRSRTSFTGEQIEILEREFRLCNYPDVIKKKSLAAITGLEESRLQVSDINIMNRPRES